MELGETKFMVKLRLLFCLICVAAVSLPPVVAQGRREKRLPDFVRAESTGPVTASAARDIVQIIQVDGMLSLHITSVSRAWDEPLLGSYVYSSASVRGLELLDIDGDGRAEIVAITSDGASLGAYLRVYRYDSSGGFELITPPDAGGFQFEFEPRGGGIQIAEHGSWTSPELTQARVLAWDGSKLAWDREVSTRAFLRKREQLLRGALSRTPQSAGTRTTQALLVATLFEKAHEPARALELCHELLAMLDDLTLTIPIKRQPADVKDLTAEQRRLLFDSERLNYRAATHRALARIYTDLGRLQEAEQHKNTADQLGSRRDLELEQVRPRI